MEGGEEEVTHPRWSTTTNISTSTREHHDLAPVHNILVQLAVSLQARVDQVLPVVMVTEVARMVVMVMVVGNDLSKCPNLPRGALPPRF